MSSAMIMPHDEANEQIALGSLVVAGFNEEHPRLLQGFSMLQVDDFYSGGHRLLFEAIRRLYDAGMVMDLPLIRDELQRSGQLEAVGGIDYLVQIMHLVPTSTNTKYYCQLVVRDSVRRSLMAHGEKLRELAHNGLDVESLNMAADNHQHEVEKTIKRLKPAGREVETSMSERLGQIIAGQYRALGTPWERIDTLTRALLPGTVTLLCGGMDQSTSKKRSFLQYWTN